jgi:hypothetical protein
LHIKKAPWVLLLLLSPSADAPLSKKQMCIGKTISGSRAFCLNALARHGAESVVLDRFLKYFKGFLPHRQQDLPQSNTITYTSLQLITAALAP